MTNRNRIKGGANLAGREWQMDLDAEDAVRLAAGERRAQASAHRLDGAGMASDVRPARGGGGGGGGGQAVELAPTISMRAALQGQPVYDMVNRRGELFDRVQLPSFREIAGFGPRIRRAFSMCMCSCESSMRVGRAS